MNTCTHTAVEDNPWWEVDFGAPRSVVSVTVYNRADCCGTRLDRFDVLLDGEPCAEGVPVTTAGEV